MPAAHALVQAREDITSGLADAEPQELWACPGGAASAGFHLRHLSGSLDRLLTYAQGERHTGQFITTLTIVRGLGLSGSA
jgi:hypothetical protein